MEDRRVTERQLVQEVKISVESEEKIIHDHMHLGKVSARMIPRLLTPLQKLKWVKFTKAILTMYQENQDYYDSLISQNKTRVHHYDLETKAMETL